jgi:hypothetical protein
MGTKVQLRAGEVELTIESDNPLAVTDIKELLAQVQEAAEALQATQSSSTSATLAPAGTQSGTLLLEHTAPQLHVNSVAQRIGIKTGADLAVAAAGYLQVVKGQPSFTRKELLETMRSATSHFTQTHRSNLSAILKGLIGSKLNQTGTDLYSLKHQELIDLRAKLAE